MMLTSDELNRAILQAQCEAAVCTRFCVVGGERHESTYLLFHNGLGSSDTSEQLVYAGPILKLSELNLVRWLSSWLVATHKRQRFDLNVRGEHDSRAI
jgi:hypothetical protein